MRLILSDAASGGVIAVLAAGFVLLQVFVSAFACGSHVESDPDGRMVICRGLGTMSVFPGSSDGRTADGDHGCPCATLCGMGLTGAVAASDQDLGAAYSLRDVVDIRYSIDNIERPTPRLLRLIPPPRGPPVVSA